MKVVLVSPGCDRKLHYDGLERVQHESEAQSEKSYDQITSDQSRSGRIVIWNEEKMSRTMEFDRGSRSVP